MGAVREAALSELEKLKEKAQERLDTDQQCSPCQAYHMAIEDAIAVVKKEVDYY